jgi:hypothetical protein
VVVVVVEVVAVVVEVVRDAVREVRVWGVATVMVRWVAPMQEQALE